MPKHLIPCSECHKQVILDTNTELVTKYKSTGEGNLLFKTPKTFLWECPWCKTADEYSPNRKATK